MVIQYFTECLQKNFHQASDFIFWEFSILGIFPSVEKSFNFFFLLLITGIILWLYYVESWMIGINKIYPHSNHHYASVFLPFLSSLQFEIISLLHKFSTVDTLLFNASAKAEFLATILLVYWKVFHLYCIISKPFHSSLSIPNDAWRTASILCIME